MTIDAKPTLLETQWIDQALHGNLDGFDALYRAHSRRILGYLVRSGFAPAEAEDLCQETFLRAFRALPTYDERKGRFGTWISSIARNLVRKQWARRKSPENFDPELAEEMLAAVGNSPRAEAADREECDAVQDCINLLPNELQWVVSLRYVRGLTTRGIAEETSFPEATVRLRLKEAQGLLRACLAKKGFLE